MSAAARRKTRNEWIGPISVGIPIALMIVWTIKLYQEDAPIAVYERALSKTVVTSGDEVVSFWKETRNATCDSIVYRQLITADRKVIDFLPQKVQGREVGEGLPGSFTFTVPPLATEGELIYRVRSEFFCNWVQRLFGGPILPLQDLKMTYKLSSKAE